MSVYCAVMAALRAFNAAAPATSLWRMPATTLELSAVDALAPSPATMPPDPAVALAMLLLVAFGAVLYPALIAASLRPVEAMRYQ